MVGTRKGMLPATVMATHFLPGPCICLEAFASDPREGLCPIVFAILIRGIDVGVWCRLLSLSMSLAVIGYDTGAMAQIWGLGYVWVICK